MNEILYVEQIKQIGVGLAFIIFPIVFVFAFSGHKGLLKPRLLGPGELIKRARHARFLQFGHVLVLLNTCLLVVTAIHFMNLLSHGPLAWAGLVGGAMAVIGAIFLAADKGALCLTMSALDTVPDNQFEQMKPGLMAMFSKKGWLVLLWGLLLLPIGFAFQTVAILTTHALPTWQSILFLVGVMLVGFPDGAEIINLSASILMAAALIPYGLQLISAAM
jgi:hypothetical protein